MIYQLSAIWLLMTAAAAVELYDESALPDADEVLFQKEDGIDVPLHESRAQEKESARLQGLLLFKLIRSQLHQGLHDTERRPHKAVGLQEVDYEETSLAKRAAQFEQGSGLQRRWKMKKGRAVGSQMVCYFKLCAFRNPA